MAKEQDQEFVEYVVKAIVDYPGDVKVTRTIDEMGVLISLAINPEDMGKIIGKEGRTAKAIRTLLRVLGAKNNARVNMKILEPEGSTRGMAGTERPQRIEKPAPARREKPRPSPEPAGDTMPIQEENATEIV